MVYIAHGCIYDVYTCVEFMAYNTATCTCIVYHYHRAVLTFCLQIAFHIHNKLCIIRQIVCALRYDCFIAIFISRLFSAHRRWHIHQPFICVHGKGIFYASSAFYTCIVSTCFAHQCYCIVQQLVLHNHQHFIMCAPFHGCSFAHSSAFYYVRCTSPCITHSSAFYNCTL